MGDDFVTIVTYISKRVVIYLIKNKKNLTKFLYETFFLSFNTILTFKQEGDGFGYDIIFYDFFCARFISIFLFFVVWARQSNSLSAW